VPNSFFFAIGLAIGLITTIIIKETQLISTIRKDVMLFTLFLCYSSVVWTATFVHTAVYWPDGENEFREVVKRTLFIVGAPVVLPGMLLMMIGKASLSITRKLEKFKVILSKIGESEED
jgi:hypothetical protein